VDVIKHIPPVWDETIVLPPSEIGQLAVFARRAGDTWFLAVLNGTEARTIQVPLSFLGSEEYQATFVRDAMAPDAEQIENRPARRSDSLAINLRSGGGFIGRFTKK
jgi:alpha-glucosidase